MKLKTLKNFKNLKNYRKEIILILIFKILFLSLIWFVCFRDPLGDHLNDKAIVAHLVSVS